MNNKKNFDPAVKKLSEKLGCSEQEVRAAVQNGQVNRLLDKMDPGQAGQINKILSDPEASKKIMESPQAQALIKKLFGE